MQRMVDVLQHDVLGEARYGGDLEGRVDAVELEHLALEGVSGVGRPGRRHDSLVPAGSQGPRRAQKDLRIRLSGR
jgi:hypothetical protein